MGILEVDDLRKSFGTITALDGVTFEVEAGRLYVIIGPNGAGKTTLFNCITGRHRADGGVVRFRDRDISGLTEHAIAQQGIRRTFQEVEIFDSITVGESIDIAARHTGTQSVLDSLDLADIEEKYGSDLTLFERKRLALGLALDGEVMLLDELFSGLNPDEKRATVRYLDKLREEKTMVLIEHDVRTAFELADEVIVLYQGSVLAMDSPAEIRENETVRRNYFGKMSL